MFSAIAVCLSTAPFAATQEQPLLSGIDGTFAPHAMPTLSGGVEGFNVDLANENLGRSQERFAAGVTDSVEVVQAEQSLASANDQYISSLYSHNLAKLQLARGLGVARTNYSQYLAVH